MALEALKAQVEDALTFIKWLEAEKSPLCDSLATTVQNIETANAGRPGEAQARVDAALATLYPLVRLEGPPVETEMAFKDRIEGLFNAEMPPPATTSANIVVPSMPNVCTQTAAAFNSLNMFIEDLEKVLTYETWLNAQRTGSCDALTNEFMNEMNTKTVDLNA